MTLRTRSTAAALMALALLSGCADDEPDPADSPEPAPTLTSEAPPTEPVAFTEGDAEVSVTGDIEETFTATIDETDSRYEPEDAEHELLWTNADGRVLRLTTTIVDGAVEDAFVAIGAPGISIDDENYFPDAFHTQCEVTVSTATTTEIEGEFTCDDLESSDGEKTVDATGTFSASA